MFEAIQDHNECPQCYRIDIVEEFVKDNRNPFTTEGSSHYKFY